MLDPKWELFSHHPTPADTQTNIQTVTLKTHTHTQKHTHKGKFMNTDTFKKYKHFINETLKVLCVI